MRRFRILSYGATLVLGVALGSLLPLLRQQHGARSVRPVASNPGSSSLPSTNSPWGELECLEFPLDCATALPSVIDELTAPSQWRFPDATLDQVADTLRNCGLDGEDLSAAMDSAQWEVEIPGLEGFRRASVALDDCRTNMVWISPAPALVLKLGQRVRQRVYSVLAASELNPEYRYPLAFTSDELDGRLARSGLSASRLAEVKRLSYTNDGRVCLADLGALRELLDTNEIAALCRSLCQTTTLLARLRVSPDSDLDALLKYWDRGDRTRQIKPLLEGLARTPGGATIGMSVLMPPYARSRLYTARASASSKGSMPNGLCTALNFFNEQLDPRYLQAEEALRAFRTEYEEAKGSPAYGDLVTFSTPAGEIKHVSVYMADDVVFARRRVGTIQQWFLAKLEDLGRNHRLTGASRMAFYRRKGL